MSQFKEELSRTITLHETTMFAWIPTLDKPEKIVVQDPVVAKQYSTSRAKHAGELPNDTRNWLPLSG